MDNLTHTLFALVMAKGGLERATPRATAALLIGANLPDIDLVTLLWGNIHYLSYHRGFTHSILGITLGALILAFTIYGENNLVRRAATEPRFLRLFLVALAGTASHFLLDYTNSYGIRPFLPFNDQWFAWDLVFIVDPWILFIFFIGLGLPFLLRLVTQEIGAKATGYRLGSLVCLSLVVLYWGAKDISHRSSLRELQSKNFLTGEPIRLAALPQFLNPFGWYGIAETQTSYHTTFVGWSPDQDGYDRRRIRTFHKMEPSEILENASQGQRVKVFLNFARFPLFQVAPSPAGYEVTVRDLRFDFASQTRKGFLFTIVLDKSLRIASEEFRF